MQCCCYVVHPPAKHLSLSRPGPKETPISTKSVPLSTYTPHQGSSAPQPVTGSLCIISSFRLCGKKCCVATHSPMLPVLCPGSRRHSLHPQVSLPTYIGLCRLCDSYRGLPPTQQAYHKYTDNNARQGQTQAPTRQNCALCSCSVMPAAHTQQHQPDTERRRNLTNQIVQPNLGLGVRGPHYERGR